MSENQHKYKIRYEFNKDVGEFTKEEIEKFGCGGTDAYVFFSILYPEDGSYSQTHVSLDGRTGEPLDRNELFKLWLTLSSLLKNSEELPEWKRIIAESAFDLFKKIRGIE